MNLKLFLGGLFAAGLLGLVLFLNSSPASAEETNSRPVPPSEFAAHFAAVQAEHEDLLTAIKNNDYAAWRALIDSRPKITDFINADNFSRFTDLHQAMQSGDIETAKAIREELGLPGFKIGFGKMMGHRHPFPFSESTKTGLSD